MNKILSRNGCLKERPDLKDYLILELNGFVINNWKENPRQMIDIMKYDIKNIVNLMKNGDRLISYKMR
jgi:hypothetical protein